MEVKNYAIIDESGHVVNMAVWDGASPWSPGDQYLVVQSDVASIGWSYDRVTGEFAAPSA